MNTARKKRIILRISVMVVVAALLAVLPPILIRQALWGAFQFNDDMQLATNEYITQLKWCHMAGIFVLFLVNLGYFILNEKRGDSGIILKNRVAGQNWCNFFAILLIVGIMAGLNYVVYMSEGIGFLESLVDNTLITKITALMPYYVFIISGIILWLTCVRAVPATNCYLRCWLSRKIDSSLIKAKPARK